MPFGRGAATVVVYENRFVAPFVEMIGKDGTRLDVYMLTDYAVAHKIKMGDNTVFQYCARLYFATDADLCPGRKEHSVAQTGVRSDEAVGGDDCRCFYGHIVPDSGRLVDGNLVFYNIILSERADQRAQNILEVCNDLPRRLVVGERECSLSGYVLFNHDMTIKQYARVLKISLYTSVYTAPNWQKASHRFDKTLSTFCIKRGVLQIPRRHQMGKRLRLQKIRSRIIAKACNEVGHRVLLC